MLKLTCFGRMHYWHHRSSSFSKRKPDKSETNLESQDYKAQNEQKTCLRSEGRCFRCELKGHMLKDCLEVCYEADRNSNIESNAVYMADYHDEHTGSNSGC
jgi:hypothetical protein